MALKSGIDLAFLLPSDFLHTASLGIFPPTNHPPHSPDAFPSSAAFDLINTALSSSPAERTDAIKKGNAIFAFTLKNSSGATESWYIDLKEKGEVVKGDPASQGKKADVSLSLSDEDFGKMVGGKTQAQRLFMSGKLKIKGDVMKVRFL